MKLSPAFYKSRDHPPRHTYGKEWGGEHIDVLEGPRMLDGNASGCRTRGGINSARQSKSHTSICTNIPVLMPHP